MTAKGRGLSTAVVCPYCQNADPTLIDEEPPVQGWRKFACLVCSRVFVLPVDAGKGAR